MLTHEEYNARARKYYYDHREQRLAERKQHRIDHADEESATRRAHYQKNKEKIKANVNAYRKAHPEVAKAWRAANKDKIKKRQRAHGLKRWYGITVEEYDAILQKQGGICIICGIRPEEINRQFSVDHDHETGKIRGILCPKCNLILGHSGDSIAVLERAIAYLERSEELP